MIMITKDKILEFLKKTIKKKIKETPNNEPVKDTTIIIQEQGSTELYTISTIDEHDVAEKNDELTTKEQNELELEFKRDGIFIIIFMIFVIILTILVSLMVLNGYGYGNYFFVSH